MDKRSRPWPFVAVFVAFMGLAAFYNVATRPRFAAFAGVDVVGLLAAGMCFGAAITTLVAFRRSRRSD